MRKPDVDLRVVRRIANEALPGCGPLAVERTEDGVSTQVYRLRRDDATFYLRVAEEAQASLAPEVLVHDLLRARGVRVPEIVHFVPCDESLQRAVMITAEIAGDPISRSHDGRDIRDVVVEAGRDLAVINSVPVAGFGWIRRDGSVTSHLEAEFATHRAFALADLDEQLDRLRGVFLTAEAVESVLRTIARHERWLDVDRAHLAHGDMDATHIYHHHGRYTGIIDFGEIRGADQIYDLAHFALHDGEMAPAPLLPHLLAGYNDVAPIAADDEPRIHFLALLIGIGALARSMNRPQAAYQDFLSGSVRRSLRLLAG
jgi:aminoglycoside phosphotransferase (APT) family kinase protein